MKTFLVLLSACFSVSLFGQGLKITDLPAASAVTTDDLLMIVNDPAGTPANQKITTANFKASIYASPVFTGVPTIPTPFTLGAVSVTATGTEMNYLIGVTSAIQTQLNNRQATNAVLTRIQGIGAGVSGDVVYRDATGWTNLAKGADGTVLKLASGLPAWGTDIQAAGGTLVGTVSNNVASAGLLAVDSTKTNGIAATSAHVQTTLGNIYQATNATLTRVQGIGAGTSGDILYRDATGWTNLAKAADGTVLKLTSGFPAWGAVSGTGDVVGPSSSTDNAIARFDSTTGKLIQNSVGLLSDVGALTAIESITATNAVTAGSFASVGSGVGALTLWDADGDHHINYIAASTITTDLNWISPAAPATGFVFGTLSAVTNETISFVAATSAGISGAISDETGSGALVFGTDPTLSTIELGAASTDTTLARSSAGNMSIEGNVVYRAGGTDVAVADGGTGLSSGTSGGVLAYTASGTLASSTALAAGGIVVGGGAGVVPTSVTAGATTTILVGGGASTAPVWTTATGTGAPARAADPVFTSSLQIPNGAAPTTDAFGEIAGDNNAWASSRGAVQFFDGTANTWLVGALASDTPTTGQVPTWQTGGTITWETPSAGGGATMVGTVSNNVAVSGLLAVDATKTNGIAATLSHVTNALALTGSLSTFLNSAGTQTVPPFMSPSGYFVVPWVIGLTKFREEFIGIGSTETAFDNNWGADTLNGGTVTGAGVIDTTHQGLAALTLANQALSRTVSVIGADRFSFGGGTHYLEMCIKFDSANTGTPVWRFGFQDSRADFESADSAYARFDSFSPNWQLVTRSNGGTMVTNITSTAVGTGWKILGIKVAADTSSVKLYINGVEVASNSTGIPTGSARAMTAYMQGYRASLDGSASQIAYVDYLWHCFSPTTFP